MANAAKTVTGGPKIRRIETLGEHLVSVETGQAAWDVESRLMRVVPRHFSGKFGSHSVCWRR
jgi:hypothetical protein